MKFLHLGILFCHIVTWLAPHFIYIFTKMPPLLRSLRLLFNKKFPLPTHPLYPLTLLYFTHSTSYYLISYIFLRPYINWFCFGFFFFWSLPPWEGSHQMIENLIAFFNSISAPWTAHSTKNVNNGCWKKAIKKEEWRKQREGERMEEKQGEKDRWILAIQFGHWLLLFPSRLIYSFNNWIWVAETLKLKNILLLLSLAYIQTCSCF